MADCGNDVCEKLLENFENIGDVTFSVGPAKEEIKSCVFILRTLSPVFDKMFNENWTSQSSKVELPDIQPQVFRHFLKLILTNGLTLEKLNGLNLSIEEILHVLYIANKYHVPSVQQVCRDSLEKKIGLGNAVVIYETVQNMNEPELETTAFNYITNKIEKIVQEESFTKLSKASLMEILKCKDVKIDEIELFHGIFRWAEFQLKNVGLESNGENIRSAMGDLLFLLRFPVMSLESFFEIVYPKGILTEKEVNGISRCIALKGNPSFVNEGPFDTKDRGQKIPKYGQSFRFCPQEKMLVSQVRFSGVEDLSDLHAFRVRLCISDNQLDNVCHESSLENAGREFKQPFSMDINPPLVLEKEHAYNFQFDIRNDGLRHFLSTQTGPMKSGLQLETLRFGHPPLPIARVSTYA